MARRLNKDDNTDGDERYCRRQGLYRPRRRQASDRQTAVLWQGGTALRSLCAPSCSYHHSDIAGLFLSQHTALV